MQMGSQVFRQGTAFHSVPMADQDQNSAGLQGEFESGLSDPLQGGLLTVTHHRADASG